MKSPLLLIILVGLVPLTILGLVVTGIGFGLVLWQPPLLWKTQFGLPNADNGVAKISTDSSSVYATGYMGDPSLPRMSVLFVNRYDLNGGQVWTRQYLSTGDPIAAIAVGADSIYVGGQLNYTSFVRKYDLNGRLIWNTPFTGGPGTPYIAGIAATVGGVYTVGSALSEYDLSGNLVWSDNLTNYTGVNIFAGLGGVYISGTVCCNSQYDGGLLQKYDFNGTLSWTRRLYDPPVSVCQCTADAIASDGQGIVVVGSNSNLYALTEGFVRKYDLNGNELWTSQLSSPDHSSIGPFVSAGPSGIYLTIYTGAGHTFVMKYDGNGRPLWSFQIQAQSLRAPYSQLIPISVGDNGFYVGGVLRRTVGTDAYLASFGQSSSLILFGVNPPLSLMIMAALIGGSAAGLFSFYRRLRHWRIRPPRVGPNPHPLPATD